MLTHEQTEEALRIIWQTLAACQVRPNSYTVSNTVGKRWRRIKFFAIGIGPTALAGSSLREAGIPFEETPLNRHNPDPSAAKVSIALNVPLEFVFKATKPAARRVSSEEEGSVPYINRLARTLRRGDAAPVDLQAAARQLERFARILTNEEP